MRREAVENNRIEQIAAEKDVTSRKLWQRVKSLAGWTNSLSPTKFTTENGLVTKPAEMANLLNDFFCNKVQKICDELERRTHCDPVALLRKNMNRQVQ